MSASEDAPPRREHLEKGSTFERLEEIVTAAEDFARRFQDNDEVVHRFVLATSEAVTNAIKHGNELDADKQVAVDFRAFEGGALEVAVTDEGSGFDPSAVEDPFDEENMLRAHGRGLHIINTVADTISFEDEGRCVRMTFRRARAPE